MKGNIGIFVIVAIVGIIAIGFGIYKAYFSNPTISPVPSPTYQTLTEDPKYKEVKEKYNLSEEQLQILSTVDPNDNE